MNDSIEIGVGPIVVNSKQLANIFEVDELQVSRWRKEGMPLVEPLGKQKDRRIRLHDLREVIKWHKERVRIETSGLDGEEEGDSSYWLAKTRKETARRLLRENDLEEELTVRKALYDQRLRELGVRFRVRGEALQSTYGGRIGDDLQQLLDQLESDIRRAVDESVPA